MNISKFFIDRPIFACVLSALILLAGIVASLNMPVSEYPQVIPPSVVVHAQYPGANAKTIAETVAAPLEQSINGVEDMLYMDSKASSDGHLYLTVTFKLGTDPDKAQQLVQTRVSQAQPRLPEDVQRLGVTAIKSSPIITIAVHMVSPKGTFDNNYISNYAVLHVKDRMARIPGVGDVVLWGPGGYAMRVWLDPAALAERGLSAADVAGAIRRQNIQAAVGTIGSAPTTPEAAFQLTVNADGRLKTPDEFKNIIIKSDASGAITRLADIARVELGAEDYGIRATLNNQPAIAVAVQEAPGANSLEISREVHSAMEELAKEFPEDLEYRVVYEPSKAVQTGIDAVIKTLLEAVALVVLVVFLFLQTWRASIIPLLAVPISIVGTFTFLLLAGYSINTLSLFGLVVAIGIVVDDAIVVVENVERNIASGLSPREATYQAMQEVSGPIIAIALTLSAVFLPLAFLSGLTGEFYQQFAVTIAISTLISAVNSLTLSPALSALLLKGHGEAPDRFTRVTEKLFGRFFGRFNRFFDRGSESYGNKVGVLLKRKGTLLVVYAVLLGGTWWLTDRVPGGFVPAQDKEYLVSLAQLPEGATLDRTEETMKAMNDLALKHPAVMGTSSYSGLSINGVTKSSSTALTFVLLKPFKDRPGVSADDVAADLGKEYAKIGHAFAAIFPAPPVYGLGTLGGFKFQIEDRADLGYEELYKATQAFIQKAAEAPELSPLYSTYTVNVPQLKVDIDRATAQQLGVETPAVLSTLQAFLGSYYVNDFNFLGRVYQVRVQADSQYRSKPDDIGQLHVRSESGQMVPIASVASVSQTYGPDQVLRYNGFTSADVTGSPAPGYSSDQAMAAIDRIAAETLPPGMTYEWTDLTYQQIIAGNSAIWILPLCVLLVFFVLAAQYESLTLPLAIILIIPMSIFSALLGVWLTDGENNIFTQIGLIVLVGLATKNAILIVEFARELEISGMPTLKAVVEASRLRLRPILMTSLAFIMGVVPLVLSTGAGAEMRQAMGISVFFGMIGVTLFGLFLTPVFYVVMRAITGGKPLHSAAHHKAPGIVPHHAELAHSENKS
ncbi:multidrug efflux RND transporter permease subunit [Pseudoxanthomonas sp. SE1]|uniref:efflux RND transporter permease subunit n=1 Tax=Pseudoxanthomonas sp. SE1 TaxID=1664560 RepID=UPI00240DAA35|nr:multidrug efflux RND transporter permease subunit [Pseudoxanthomonas sp. SE1]WFC41733.1 multidrug efflux RND transporter permease subunit [Pseudoxanthomonas sp. SE1]